MSGIHRLQHIQCLSRPIGCTPYALVSAPMRAVAFCIHIKLTSGLKGLQYALKSLTSLIRYNIPPRQLASIADNSTLAPLALRHPLSMVLPLFTYFCTVLFYKSIFFMSSIIFRIFDRNCRLRGDWPCVG